MQVALIWMHMFCRDRELKKPNVFCRGICIADFLKLIQVHSVRMLLRPHLQACTWHSLCSPRRFRGTVYLQLASRLHIFVVSTMVMGSSLIRVMVLAGLDGHSRESVIPVALNLPVVCRVSSPSPSLAAYLSLQYKYLAIL